MFTPRPYQKEAVDEMLRHFFDGKKSDIPIVVAPTAAGKSVYIALTAKEIKNDGIIVFQPSEELLRQNYEKYIACGGEATIYSASVGEKKISRVTFAMIGSVVNIPEQFSHVRKVIIDECHLVPPSGGSMYIKFFKSMKDIKVVGLTATAVRLKKYRNPFTGQPYSQLNLLTRERPRFFNDFIHITQIEDLYKMGYLAPLTYAPMEWNGGELKLNSTGAEFTEDSMDLAIKNHKIIEKLPAIIAASMKKGRKHRLVFVRSVVDAMSLARQVPRAACVHALTKKKERAQIIEDFKKGKITTIFNVGVLTTGFDFPALDTIIIARPTMSLTLYMQMAGRGIRICDGKKDCVLVDMCGNIKRFGKIENIKYTFDPKAKGYIIHNGERQLTGVPLESIK